MTRPSIRRKMKTEAQHRHIGLHADAYDVALLKGIKETIEIDYRESPLAKRRHENRKVSY